MIDEQATYQKFGYWPSKLKAGSNKHIVYLCAMCQIPVLTPLRCYKEGSKCRSCARRVKRISKEDIAQDISRVAKQLGHQPTCEEYEAVGKYALPTLRETFGLGWKEMLQTLGYVLVRRRSDTYTIEQVKAELISVRSQLGHIPHSREYDKVGNISRTTVCRVIGTTNWAEVVMKVFGLKAEQAKEFRRNADKIKPIEPKLTQLQLLATELGHPPSGVEATKHGIDTHYLKHKLQTNWLGVIKAAKLDPKNLPPRSQAALTPDESVLLDIRILAKALGRCPTTIEYQEKGKFTIQTVRRRFGSWEQALAVAKLEPTKRYKNHKAGIYKPTEHYIEKLRDLAEKLGRSPTLTEADDNQINSQILTKRLNTNWVGVLKEAGLNVESLPSQSRLVYVTNEEIIEDIKAIAKLLGQLPRRKDYIEQGAFNIAFVRKRLGGSSRSWANVLKCCQLEVEANHDQVNDLP